jgi:hypothetical protein
MKNKYHVTSCVWFSLNVTTHGITFVPFPSEHFLAILMPCFPSMIFTQLISIKRSLRQLLNTRSLSSTWLYLVRDASMVIENSSVVSCAVDIVIDEFIQHSCRGQQLSFWIGGIIWYYCWGWWSALYC